LSVARGSLGLQHSTEPALQPRRPVYRCCYPRQRSAKRLGPDETRPHSALGSRLATLTMSVTWGFDPSAQGTLVPTLPLAPAPRRCVPLRTSAPESRRVRHRQGRPSYPHRPSVEHFCAREELGVGRARHQRRDRHTAVLELVVQRRARTGRGLGGVVDRLEAPRHRRGDRRGEQHRPSPRPTVSLSSSFARCTVERTFRSMI